jgi:outer membrane protein OmpA-like peptidoglycan-associated protein
MGGANREGGEYMAQDWLADVRKYVADADEKVVKAIVRYCGIALQKVDSSLVSFSDSKETDRVRENYLKKKLGLKHSDADLDAAIAAVGVRMKADRTKNRVTVYYLLAEHFGSLGTFGGAAGVAAAAPVAAAAAATTAPLAAMAAAAPAKASSSNAAATSVPGRAAARGPLRPDDGIFGWGCGIALVVFGCIIAAALLAWAMMRTVDAPAAAPAPAVTTPAPAPVVAEPAPAIPVGSGVIGEERNGKPMLTVYFDTGKSDVTKDLAAAAASVKKYVADNPGSKLAVSGFNDPTGNAAANAALSKRRAQEVGKALEAIGIPAASIELVKPAAATDASGDNTNARRVEVVVQ